MTIEDQEEHIPLPTSIWHLGIDDAHCHPTDTMPTTTSIPTMKTRYLTIMSTRADDQDRVADIARSYPDRIIPSFGWHPWFSHQLTFHPEMSKTEHYTQVLTPKPNAEILAALPDPRPIQEFLDEVRAHLDEFPHGMVGEIGLDRTFRLPNSAVGWRREDMSQEAVQSGQKRLSAFKVQPAHQKMVLEAQLKLAGEMKRGVSVHGVGAHGALYEVFDGLFKGYEKEVVGRRARIRGKHDFEGDYDDNEDEYDDEDSDVSDREASTSGSAAAQEQDTDKSNTKKENEQELRPFPPRICLHSFSAPPDFLQTWISPKLPADIYFSFSTAINSRYGSKFEEMLKIVPEDKLLIESDLHTAGKDMERHLEEVIQEIARVRGWSEEDTVKKVGRNYLRFIGKSPS